MTDQYLRKNVSNAMKMINSKTFMTIEFFLRIRMELKSRIPLGLVQKQHFSMKKLKVFFFHLKSKVTYLRSTGPVYMYKLSNLLLLYFYLTHECLA